MKEPGAAEAPAKGEPEAPPAPEKPGAAGIDMVFGFGQTGTKSRPSDVTSASFLIGGSYRVTPTLALRLRVPFATAKITDFGQEGYNSTSFGNVEIAGAYIVDMGPHTTLPIELAFTPPTSNGDFFPLSNVGGQRHFEVNSAAQASRGFEEDALFAPHRFGIIPGAALRYRNGAIQTGAFTKIPILIRAGGSDPPKPVVPTDTNFTINSPVVEWVVGGDFHLGIMDNKLDFGARAWLTYLANEFIDATLPGGTTPDKLQFVLEPQVRAAFGSFRGGLGFLWPIGGRLGSDTQINGLRLDAGLVF
jgi:hypothetical protein